MTTARFDRMIRWAIAFAGGSLAQQRQRESGLTIHEFLRREVEERQGMRHDGFVPRQERQTTGS